MEVTAHGRISVYPPQGRYQLIVDQMLPAGQGDLHLAFEALKTKLEAEGLFRHELKRSLPTYPEKIGIVTSPTGAAIRDMINIFQRRFPIAQLILLPVRVQGEGAADEIAAAIDVLNSRQDCQVIIVGRGGGSLEDLWAFNEEVVARAIARSIIPIVSAVGHETDTTISDFVADHRAPTPSAAAELVVPDRVDLISRLVRVTHSLHDGLLHRIQRYEHRLDSILHSYALKKPVLMIDQSMQRLDQIQDSSIRSSRDRLTYLNNKLEGLSQQIAALNPLSILNRGYSILSSKEGRIIRSVDQVKLKDKIQIRLADGEIDSTVDAIGSKK